MEAQGPVCWGGAFNTQFEGMAEWWGWGVGCSSGGTQTRLLG